MSLREPLGGIGKEERVGLDPWAKCLEEQFGIMQFVVMI